MSPSQSGRDNAAEYVGAATLAMMVAFNVGASEPFVVEPGQTLKQASDNWYAKNQGDYTASPGAATMGVAIDDKPAEFKSAGQAAAPGSEAMGVLIEDKDDPTAARSGPAGALPDTSAAMGVVIEDKDDPTAARSGPPGRREPCFRLAFEESP